MKKNNSKEAKFFCENCAREVKQDARVCNFCGKFFSSVKCPRCGKSGSSNEFKKGCPACGYAVNPNAIFYSKNNSINNQNIQYNSQLNKNHFYITKPKTIIRKRAKNNDSLPLWVYILCVSVLVVIILCLYSC